MISKESRDSIMQFFSSRIAGTFSSRLASRFRVRFLSRLEAEALERLMRALGDPSVCQGEVIEQLKRFSGALDGKMLEIIVGVEK